MGKIRRHYIFYGRVQGVGFRWRAKYAAQTFEITGWVENLADGSVEMEAQGLEENIDKMLLSIEKSSFVLIENLSVEDIPLKDEREFYVK